MGTKGFLFGYNFEKKLNYQEYFIVNYVNSINESKRKKTANVVSL